MSAWTPARIATLERMWREGCLMREIAHALDVGEETARRQGISLGLPARNIAWTDERTAQLIEMYAAGLYGTEIATTLGVSRGAVMGKLDRLGLLGSRRRRKKHGQAGRRPMALQDAEPVVAHRAGAGGPCEVPATSSSGRVIAGTLTHRSAGGGGPLGPSAFSSRAAPGNAQILPNLAPVADDAAGAPFGDAVTIEHLTPFTCRWPVGGKREPATHFCGAVTPSSQPYCAHHTVVATNPEYQPRRMVSAPTSSRTTLEGYGYADQFLGGE